MINIGIMVWRAAQLQFLPKFWRRYEKSDAFSDKKEKHATKTIKLDKELIICYKIMLNNGKIVA